MPDPGFCLTEAPFYGVRFRGRATNRFNQDSCGAVAACLLLPRPLGWTVEEVA
jgi:hypothetical protein